MRDMISSSGERAGRESYGGPQQTLRTATMMFRLIHIGKCSLSGPHRRCLVALVLFAPCAGLELGVLAEVCQSAAFCQAWITSKIGIECLEVLPVSHAFPVVIGGNR